MEKIRIVIADDHACCAPARERSRIMHKLNMHRKSELVNYAVRYKLVNM